MLSESLPPATLLTRKWPIAEKRRIVELTLQPGTSVKSVAEEYQLDTSTLSQWRTHYRKGLLEQMPRTKKAKNRQTDFLPVTINAAPTIKGSAHAIVTIQISSEVSLKIEAETLDYSALGTLIAQIRQ